MKPKESRQSLSLDIDLKIPPGATAQITTDPVERSFLPETWRVASPRLWMIDRVAIDDRLLAKGPFSGVNLAGVALPKLRRGQKVVLTVTYRGRAKDGRAFRGAIVGA